MEDVWTNKNRTKQSKNWTITAQESKVDELTFDQVTVIITKETPSSDIHVINQITVPKSLDLYRLGKWDKHKQTQYHKQYRINTSKTENCADKIKVGQYLLIVLCRKNGAITIYRRYRDSNGVYSINTKTPLVEQSSLARNLSDCTIRDYGEDIAIIDHFSIN